MLHRFRMLMNAQDGSPGGGSVPSGAPPATPAAAQPQAQGAGLTIDQVKELLSGFGDQIVAKTRDSVFAEARKAGMFGGKGKEPEPEPKTKDATIAPNLSKDDVQRMMARTRAFERAAANLKLTDAAIAKMERAFEMDNPDDVATWVKDFATAFGLGAAPAPATAQASTPQTMTTTNPTTPPVSNTGSPAPSVTPTGDVPLVRLSKEDLKSELKRLGLQGYRKRYWDEMRSLRVKVRNY